MVVLYMLSFAIGLGPVPWLMVGEIFPVDIRSLAGRAVLNLAPHSDLSSLTRNQLPYVR